MGEGVYLSLAPSSQVVGWLSTKAESRMEMETKLLCNPRMEGPPVQARVVVQH